MVSKRDKGWEELEVGGGCIKLDLFACSGRGQGDIKAVFEQTIKHFIGM